MNEDVKKEIERKVSDLYDYCVENEIPLLVTLGKDNEMLYTAAMWKLIDMVALLTEAINRTCKCADMDSTEFCESFAEFFAKSKVEEVGKD